MLAGRTAHDYLAYAGFVVVPLLIYGSVVVFPALYSIAISFTSWETLGQVELSGLRNYAEIFSDSVFFLALRNNLLIAAVSIFGQIPAGFLLAYLFHRRLIRGGGLFKPMVFLPVAISSIIVGVLWDQLLLSNGPVVVILRWLLRDPAYTITIMQSKLAMIPILIVIFWMYTGIYMIIFLANMQRLEPSLFEAAVLDSLNEIQILYYIVAPLLVNVVFTCIIFAITGSLKSFDLIFAMTAGGPNHATENLAIYMYLRSFKFNEYGVGGAVSVVLIILCVLFILLLQKIFARFTRKFLG